MRICNYILLNFLLILIISNITNAVSLNEEQNNNDFFEGCWIANSSLISTGYYIKVLKNNSTSNSKHSYLVSIIRSADNSIVSTQNLESNDAYDTNSKKIGIVIGKSIWSWNDYPLTNVLFVKNSTNSEVIRLAYRIPIKNKNSSEKQKFIYYSSNFANKIICEN